MSKRLIGRCVKCSAPIYIPTVWYGIYPPEPEYTCACEQNKKQPLDWSK